MHFQTHNNRQVTDDEGRVTDRIADLAEGRAFCKRMTVEHSGFQLDWFCFCCRWSFAFIRGWLLGSRLLAKDAPYLGFDLLALRCLGLVLFLLVVGA